ncbi:MAG: hypothetical protein JRJ21_11240 [Deltaproteobacteria bacterium]|nr:hypothetical protein [Deltaproteobacteria bacterium]
MSPLFSNIRLLSIPLTMKGGLPEPARHREFRRGGRASISVFLGMLAKLNARYKGDAVPSAFPKGKQHGDFEGLARIHK